MGVFKRPARGVMRRTPWGRRREKKVAKKAGLKERRAERASFAKGKSGSGPSLSENTEKLFAATPR